MNTLALGHPYYQIPFFLSVYDKEGNALVILTPKHWAHHQPIGYYSQQLGPVAFGSPPCLRDIMATALLVKATKKIIVGSPLTVSVPHTVETLLNSDHTQHFSAHFFTSYKLLLLTAPHIILLCCNNLKSVTLLPYITTEVLHNCLTLMDHLLTPCNNLQEIPLGKSAFSWFIDGSYLKVDNGKYCAGMILQFLLMLLRQHLYL